MTETPLSTACPANLLCESTLRALERRAGQRLTPAQLRSALQADARLASSAVPPPARKYDSLEAWLADEDAFLGYRMDLLYRRAEIRLYCLDALRALCNLLNADAGPDTDAAWRALLDAEEARFASRARQDAAVAALRGVCARADADWEALAARLVAPRADGPWAAIFNLYPARQTMFTCIRSKGPVSVYLGDRRLPSQFIDGDDATAIEIEMDGLSVESVRIEPDGPAYERLPLGAPYRFENDVMRVEVQPDGRVTALESKRFGPQLRLGNLLRGRWRDASGRDVLLRGEDIPVRARVVKGELFDNIYLEGGDGGVRIGMVLYLPRHGSRRVEIMLDVEFDDAVRADFIASGGALWLEWRTAFERPRVLCDRPFGWAACAEGTPLRSSNGVGVTRDGHGLIFDHQGVTRGWFRGDTLYTLLARGGARAGEDAPAGQLDARTPDSPDRKKWRFFYAIDLADDDAPEALFGRATGYQFPMLPIRCAEPFSARGLLTLGDGLIPTALLPEGGGALLRGYNAADRPVPPRAKGLLGFEDREPLQPFAILEKALRSPSSAEQ